MLRYFALGILLTGLLIGTQLYLKQSNSAEPKLTATMAGPGRATVTHAKPIRSGSEPDNLNTNVQTVHDPGSNTEPALASESLELSYSEPSDSESGQSEPVQIWQEDEDPPLPPSRYTNKGIDARPLKLAKQQFSNLNVGDRVELPIPQTSASYDMSIKQVGRHRNGDKTLKGHLTNQPQYAVIVTEGQNTTYATINTPDGSFMLEAKQDQGWLVAANDLDSLADPNLPDYQIPDINRNLN